MESIREAGWAVALADAVADVEDVADVLAEETEAGSLPDPPHPDSNAESNDTKVSKKVLIKITSC